MPDNKPEPADARRGRRRISLWKKLLFAAVAVSVFFALIELALWAAGVDTLIEKEDPFRGFSGLVTVFERDGAVYRTRRATIGSTFNDQSFLAKKPANGLRIFCLGGSSSYGFPWGADAAFTAVLGKLLAASHPELRVEAVNASGVSYAMHRLNIVADELLKYEPDVFIIYSGHNEFIEPAFFAALKRRGSVHTRVEYALAHSRVYSGVRTILGHGADAEHALADDFDATVRRDDTRVFSPQEKEAIVAEYRWRLERLVRVARKAGVKVLVATIPCNLRGWRPEASGGVAALSEEERRTWSEAFASGKRHLAGGESEAAKADLERAARLASGHAETQFVLGQAYEALGQWDDARAAYGRACDADASPSRRPSGINEAIREVARQRGVLLVDVDHLFEELSAPRPVGFNLIEDYVHPTQEGHELIAWHMWDAMARAGWLGDEASADQAVFDRAIAERRLQPMTKNATWFYNQGVVLENQGQTKAAIEKYREAVAIADHAGAMANLGGLLIKTGRAAEAVGLLERAIKVDPNYVIAHNNLGAALYRLGRLKEAAERCEQALRLRPDYPQAHNNLANALLGLKRFNEAATHYREAVRLNPDWAEAHINLGLALQSVGRTDEAVECYEEALRLNPGLVAVRIGLADTLLALKRLKEAAGHYREVLRLEPNLAGAKTGLAQAHNGLGLDFERSRRFKEAMSHYEQALRAKPDFGPACNNLAWLLATCPDATHRDAKKAVAIATRACELSGWKHFDPLDTLAAAYAESGDFAEAVRWQTKAVELAPEGAKAELQSRLELYTAGKPYRLPPKK